MRKAFTARRIAALAAVFVATFLHGCGATSMDGTRLCIDLQRVVEQIESRVGDGGSSANSDSGASTYVARDALVLCDDSGDDGSDEGTGGASSPVPGDRPCQVALTGTLERER